MAFALRLLAAIPTLAGVVVATFALTRILPGDPAAFFTSTPGADAATIEAVRRTLGLDEPLWRQFVLYVAALARGDLGQSITTGRPVLADLALRLPASAELTLAAFALAASAGPGLGIAAALRPGGFADRLCRLIVTLGVALPSFVVGLLLIDLFYVRAGWAPAPLGRLDAFAVAPPPVTGLLLIDALLAGEGETFVDAARHLALPAATLALFALAPLARITRAAMLAALGSDQVRAARALGLARRKIVLTYALRNAATPILTALGMVFAYMLGGNVLVERVFAWPGVGSYVVDALAGLDHAPVQGFVLMTAALSIAINLLVDLACALVDPRARLFADG